MYSYLSNVYLKLEECLAFLAFFFVLLKEMQQYICHMNGFGAQSYRDLVGESESTLFHETWHKT